MSKKILFIGGSLNQTTMMHKISINLNEYESFFTPYYSNGFLGQLAKTSILDFSILGGKFRSTTHEYLKKEKLNIDFGGRNNNYDIIFTCSDLIIPKNIREKKIILVQEGMTDPEGILHHIVKFFRLPRWLASTSMTGLSNMYNKFCVASEGYRALFINKGVKPSKIEVTGIPNFDDVEKFKNNNFPHKDFVLVATSDTRETFKYENRKKFIRKAVTIANGRKIIFKLHPNENHERAIKEIKSLSSDALIYTSGNTENMVANCKILITRFSSVAYIGLILGKEVYSEFNINDLRKLIPIQNNGRSAFNISQVARRLMETETFSLTPAKYISKFKTLFQSSLRKSFE